MRLPLVAPLAVAVVAVLGAQNTTPDPTTILAAAREALGGEKQLTAVKTFVARGRTQQVRGDNLVPIEFELTMRFFILRRALGADTVEETTFDRFRINSRIDPRKFQP